MKRSSEGISSERKQRRNKGIKHTVTDNVRQGFDWCWITGVLSIEMTKQSEAVIAYLIGHDPGMEQRRHPTMGRLDEGI